MLGKYPKIRKNLYFCRGFVIGAAGRIRTADLILTKEIKTQYSQCFPVLVRRLYEVFQFCELVFAPALAYVRIDLSGELFV